MLHASRYNVLVEQADESLLFNTATGAFATLGPQAADAYHADAASGQLQTGLRDAGFLTHASPDEELAVLRARFEGQRHDHSTLTLALVPTYACNYHCPYCYEQATRELGGMMTERVMDAIMRFMEKRYESCAYRALHIQWYGGDPSLALDVVDELSEDMMAFCDERGISYDALILSNCAALDEDAIALLERARVSLALLTIDGFESTHNARRVAPAGTNSYERVIEAARCMKAHGIAVSAVMNVDKVNWREYPALRDMLRDELGIHLEFCRLSDCGHMYGTGAFTPPTFDLLSPDEFADLQYEQFVAAGFTADDMRALLAAPPRFCNGQQDNYFTIDCVGNVFSCDGYIGHDDHIEFSVFDTPAPEQLELLSHDPFTHTQCRACTLLPICLGNCDWERRTDQMQCHPLKRSLPRYLRSYRSCFASTPDENGFAVLAAGSIA